MNAVSVIGMLIEEPELRTAPTGEQECRMRVAVSRYSPGGTREPGFVYLYASSFGLRAQEHADSLSRGDRIGLSGRFDGEPNSTALHVDQLDPL